MLCPLYWEIIDCRFVCLRNLAWPTLAFIACRRLLDTLRGHPAADWALHVPRWQQWRQFRRVTPPLLFYTLQNLIQHITWRKVAMNAKEKKLSNLLVFLREHTHLPELGQRRLKSSLVSRHRALPFISKHPFSGWRSEYSFWAQWSQWATSSLSHRDGLIPGEQAIQGQIQVFLMEAAES